MKFSRYDPHYSSYQRWKDICPEGTWRTDVEPDSLYGFIPDDLLRKANSVFVLSSASPEATAFIANLNRVDMPAKELDQHPYIAVFGHKDCSASGGFVDHGHWCGRTTKL